uniref:Podocin n=1 Tax=Myripristis murdjan TaxID=586833 RepID=A0A667WDM2_9TELE
MITLQYYHIAAARWSTLTQYRTNFKTFCTNMSFGPQKGEKIGIEDNCSRKLVSHMFCLVVREHERAVIFRLGHLLRGRPRGPGLLFYLPFLDVCQKVDIRLKMLKVPPHTVVTKDLLRPELSSVCYYRVENVALCSTAVSSLTSVLQTLVQAAARDVLAQHKFTHIQLDRRRLGQQIQAAADSVACRWGVRVERTDIHIEPTYTKDNQITEDITERERRDDKKRKTGNKQKKRETVRAQQNSSKNNFNHIKNMIKVDYASIKNNQSW